MMAHSVGVQLEARMEGGLLKGLKRSVLGGESSFVTTFTAPPEGGWIDLAARLPGDLRAREGGPRHGPVGRGVRGVRVSPHRSW